MNERGKARAGEDETGSGVSLTLIYSLIVLALISAIGIAAFIVLPFYHRR
jgi:hypothetical protein